MYEKLDKLRADLKRAREKKADIEAKIKNLEQRLKEAEESQILTDVKQLNLTPEQLALLQGKKSGSPKKTGDKKVINVTEITDKELWDTMSASYGENALRGKGYHYFDE